MRRTTTVMSDRCGNSPALSRFVEQLPGIFDMSGEVLHKERNVIKSFKVEPSGRLVVKRYKRPGFLQGILYGFFRRSKAERAFRNAGELRKRGIDTPREIAFVEQKRGGRLEYGFYVSENTCHPPIREQLVEPEDFNRDMARDFAAFAAQLHGKGILHHDLNSTNTLYHYVEEENGYVFSLIDINRMYFYPPGRRPSLKLCLENLTRFTGRMDLFEYVMQCYCDIRKLEGDIVANALRIKKAHDERWQKRKTFLKKFKPRSIQSSQ